MKATRTSETSADFERTTRRYIPEERTLHDHRSENLMFYETTQVGTATVIEQLMLGS
jgi:hypothetical protein